MHDQDDDRSLLEAVLGDGRPLILLAGAGLVVAGGFALFLSVTGHLLPHDVEYLGMTADQLCRFQQCRIVHFMIHDRASFGGALVGVGLLYLWLAEFPLKRGEAWAWWVFVLSGIVGFASFLSYLGYGYLDVWHAVATLALAPCFLIGAARMWPRLVPPAGWRCLLRPGSPWPWGAAGGLGRLGVLATAGGVLGAGCVITLTGMTVVFVPQDLVYLGVSQSDLHGINPRLVSLIAHDRAGFGGALASNGLAMLLTVWCARASRSLWEVLLLSGSAGFVTAIGVHPLIGYMDPVHLGPAVVAAAVFFISMTAATQRGGLRREA